MKYPININASIKTGFLTIVVILLAASSLFAQSRKELEKNRKRLIKEITLTEKLLGEAKKSREAELDHFITLQQQIKKRQQLIQTLQEEVSVTEVSIGRSTEVVEALTDDVELLKADYAKMVRTAYRQKLNNSPLLFIFSAASFNDAFRRWQYLKQYDQYRKKQAKLIGDTQQMLTQKIEVLAERKLEKEELLTSQIEQRDLLQKEIDDKEKILASLKSDEGRLVSELKKQQKKHEKLNQTIEKIIIADMAKKREESRRKKVISGIPSTPEGKGLTSDFAGSKGRLPWPVKKGVITRYFGRQPHPTLEGIQITNNGIDIRTSRDAKVQAVYGGKVTGMQYIPGFNYMVILQHGNYYTVYSNLAEVLVGKGELVKAKQVIGKVSTDRKTNTSEVHFELWRDKTRLNPAYWVAKR